MKLAAFVSLFSLAGAAVLEERNCAGNNCNRAVTGTRSGLLPLASRSADCSSFLRTTVTPSPVTITVTVTTMDGLEKKKRQATVTPSDIPEYASICSSSAAYASACTCFGITGTITTAPTPTVTVTTTDYCVEYTYISYH